MTSLHGVRFTGLKVHTSAIVEVIYLLWPLPLKPGGTKHLPRYPLVVCGSSFSGKMSHMDAAHSVVWLARMASLQAFTQSWQTPLQGRYGPFISSVHRGTKNEQPITSVNAEQFVMTLLNRINLSNCRAKKKLSLKRAVWLYPHLISLSKLGMLSFKDWH